MAATDFRPVRSDHTYRLSRFSSTYVVSFRLRRSDAAENYFTVLILAKGKLSGC